MWHEARKEEKRIRGMMVDYQRRAERRRDFYEKVKKDPRNFLVIYGSTAKIHIDADLAQQAESCMMNWQGESIDRFDGRSQLDFYQEQKNDDSEPLTVEERRLNYERYRVLVQNSCSNTDETEFLKQIEIDERAQMDKAIIAERKKKAAEEKAKLAESKAAIGFRYSDSTGEKNPAKRWDSDIVKRGPGYRSDEEDESSDDNMDVTIDVKKLSKEDQAACNHEGTYYGLGPNDFLKFLREDKREADEISKLKEEEERQAHLAGRKSRRERRLLKDKRLAQRAASGNLSALPSFALQEDSKEGLDDDDNDDSSSFSSEEERIEYITTFGGANAKSGSNENQLPAGGIVCLATTSDVEVPVIGPAPPPPDFKAEALTKAAEQASKRPGDLRRKKSPVFSPPKSNPNRRRRSPSSSPSPRRYDRRRLNDDSDEDRYRRRGSPVRRRSRTPEPRRRRSRTRSRSSSRDRRRRYDRSRRSYSSSSTSSSSSSSTSSSTSSSSSSSRSRDSRRRNRSRSRSFSRDRNTRNKTRRRSRSRSKSPFRKTDSKKNEPPPKKPALPAVKSSGGSAGSDKPKMSMQEIMRQRVQQALAKQCKADKKADREKRERLAREEFARQEQLNKLSQDLLKREEERRRQEMEAAAEASIHLESAPVIYTEEDQVFDSDLFYPADNDFDDGRDRGLPPTR